MNICLLTKTTFAHGLGGVEVHVETLSRTLPAMGHKLTIVASRHPEGTNEEERNGCAVHYLPGTRPARYNAAFFRASRDKVLELHRQDPFDILWAEDFAAYGCLDLLDRELPPLLSVMQGSGLRGLLRSEWNRINSALETIPFFIKFFPEAINCYSFWYGRISRKSNAVVAVSHETAEEYQTDHLASPKNVHVVLNSVDIERFSPQADVRRQTREQNSLSPDDIVILMAAVVHKQKGMHLGLEAFQKITGRFPRARLWVAGGGPHLEELKGLAAKLGLQDRSTFFGPVKNDDMPAYYNAADIYLNPTLRHEGLPITTVEAMACGKPVVISRIGGTPSTAEEGVSGLFVPPGNVEKIRDGLTQLLEDQPLRIKMGKEARRRAETHFNREKMAQDLLSISQNLIETHSHD